MKINKDIMKVLIEEAKGKENFLSFSLSLLSNKTTVVAELIKELKFTEETVIDYISILRENDFLTKEDDSVFKRLSSFKSEEKDYSNDIEKIIDDINVVTSSRYKVTSNRKTRLKSLLKKYTLNDFKAVHRHFLNEWGNSANMSQYLTPETLYNNKFDLRVEQALKARDEFNEYINDFEYLYIKFKSMFNESYIKDNKEIKLNALPAFSLLNNDVEIEIIDDEFNIDLIPSDLRKTIGYLLKKYSKEEIELTINITVESWSKKKELLPFINLYKILDDKFHERFIAAKRISKNNTGNFKSSVASVDAWSA